MHRSDLAVTAVTDSEQFRAGQQKKAIPQLKRRITKSPVGLIATVDGHKVAKGPDAFEAAVLNLKPALKAHDIFIRRVPGQPNFTQLNIVFQDPFKTVIYPKSLPKASKPLHVVVGPDAEGMPVELDLYLPILVIGAKGSGKSSLTWRALQGLLELGIPVRVWLYDPKFGMEFGKLKDAAYLYAKDPSECANFLTRVLTVLIEKGEALAARGLTKNSVADKDSPFDLVVIDELLDFAGMVEAVTQITVKGQKYTGKQAWTKIMSQSRAGGLSVIAGAQQPQKEVVGAARDQFDQMVCLRVTSAEQSGIVFGDKKLYPAHDLLTGDENGGIGFIKAAGRGWTKFRAAYIRDELRDRIAARLRAQSEFYWERDRLAALQAPALTPVPAQRGRNKTSSNGQVKAGV
jgi:DNA translocase FtsK/SpoIIIE-like protein